MQMITGRGFSNIEDASRIENITVFFKSSEILRNEQVSFYNGQTQAEGYLR
jgi:hypothetical protein